MVWATFRPHPSRTLGKCGVFGGASYRGESSIRFAVCLNAEELHSIRRMPITRFPMHLIFYRVENCEIVILRVIHGARDLESLF